MSRLAHTPLARVVRDVASMLLVAVAAIASGLIFGADPVSAHTAFAGSTPADGEVVAQPVSSITLTFTNESEAAGEGFVILDASGQVRPPTSVSTPDDKVFTLAFDPPLDGGEIGVRWSVRAGDAHPINGSFSFTVGAQAPVTTPTAIVPADDHMSSMTAAEMAAMDDFLEVDDQRPGETQATVGRLLSWLGIALALGAIAFAATTLRGEQIEIDVLIRAARVAGVVVALGAAIEYGGGARIAEASLGGYWSTSAGFAALLRLFAGGAMAGGLRVATATVRPVRNLSSASNTTDAVRQAEIGRADDHDRFWAVDVESDRRGVAGPGAHENRRTPRQGPTVRWVPTQASVVAFGGCLAAVMSFWFDGHTVSKGFRPIHSLANSVHVVAGSVWMGGIVSLAVLLWSRHRRGTSRGTLELVIRFSSVASLALGAVVVAGLVMAVSVLDAPGELTGTPWGQMLLLKTGAAGLAVSGGAYNHFRLLPGLDADPDSPALHERMRSVVTAEAILLTFVVIVTAWLVAATS
jgi:copper transport protein